MTQDNIPDRIYAWFFIEDKRADLMKGGWNDEPDRRETPYLKATPARKAAEDMLDDHRSVDEILTFALENGDMPANVRHSITLARDTARAAIAKAKGENT